MKVTPSQAKFDEGIERLLYETWRLNPTVKLLMRRSNQDEQYGKDTVQKGDWIVPLSSARHASIPLPFQQPKQFSLDPILPGPKRNLEDYLLFGDAAGARPPLLGQGQACALSPHRSASRRQGG